MNSERNYFSWLLKLCSDGISIDVRPPKRFQINLLSLKDIYIEGYRFDIISSSISILYSPDNIKITLYQSGRMLIETRDMNIAEKIVASVLDFFKFESSN